jgi:hypothetical protein
MQTDALKALANTQLGRMERSVVKRELTALPDVLAAGESVDMLAIAQSSTGAGLLCVTDRRLLFIDRGPRGRGGQVEATFSSIATVAHSESFSNGTLTLTVGGQHIQFARVAPKGRATEVATMLRAQITQLGTLREAGLLTDDEFAAKKAELLARM